MSTRPHSPFRRTAHAVSLLAALAVGAAPLAAQLPAGTLDPSFGGGGKLMLDFNQSTDIAHAVAVQPDGKLVVVGLTYVNNDYSKEDFALARLNPDGSFDESFGVG